MKGDGLLGCSKKCQETQTSCPIQDCKHWIEYEDEYNCSLVSIYENGPMTLRQIAERLHLSFARIKQIIRFFRCLSKHITIYFEFL